MQYRRLKHGANQVLGTAICCNSLHTMLLFKYIPSMVSFLTWHNISFKVTLYSYLPFYVTNFLVYQLSTMIIINAILCSHYFIIHNMPGMPSKENKFNIPLALFLGVEVTMLLSTNLLSNIGCHQSAIY